MAEMMTIAAAAKQLGVSVDTLKRWDSSGKLRALRSAVGHRVYSAEMLSPFMPKLPEVK